MLEQSQSLPEFAYLLLFGISALCCFGSLHRVRSIEHDDTRRGLYWLLLASGGWAASHVGYLAAPTTGLQYAFFVIGLCIGIAAVGPWLYFCSAYTGRSLHRNGTVRRTAVAVFLVIVALKVTNPAHGWYFTAEPATFPFPYLEIHHEPLHWVVMAFAYALSFVGFFMLLELFARVSFDTRILFALVALTGLPVVFDVFGAVSTVLVDITYSPVGVAAFAVGVCYVHLDRLQLVRMAGETDDPVIILDDRERIRDYNASALESFPSLADSVGTPLEEQLPTVSSTIESSDPLLETADATEPKFYRISVNPFSADRTRIGRAISFTDVTSRERYRRKLEAKNERLEEFAGVVSHDLRNPLTVAQGRTQLAIAEADTDHLEAVVDAHDRMEVLIDELLSLAREGNSIDELERLDLSAVARRSWEMIDAERAELVLETDREVAIEADPERLQQLFENLYRNALEHGGRDVTVVVGELPDGAGFFVEDDGTGIAPERRSEVFDAGYTTASNGTGFGLPIVEEIATGHGWTVRATAGRDGGARFEVAVPPDSRRVARSTSPPSEGT
ncbi:sensor histidine kinase [Natrialba swarupiae]|uniref:histidine kinase n=1 Tax=Natrialba swarupiae TaxID=2448032 RepID=A0A5D5AKR4_9EURY|nr:ATP-binding protein [Natrialba swarupiae]TYT62359.1 histidine kinase [Natrialba swarupiae]